MNLIESALGLRVYAAVAAGSLLIGAVSGAWLVHRLADHGQVQQLKAAGRQEHKAQDAADKAGEKAEAHQVQIRTVVQTQLKEVPVYVTAETDRRFAVPWGYVRLFNDAAEGRMPSPPGSAGGPDDAASPFALSEVGAVTAEDFGSCNATRQQLIDLQAFLREQQKLAR